MKKLKNKRVERRKILKERKNERDKIMKDRRKERIERTRKIKELKEQTGSKELKE